MCCNLIQQGEKFQIAPREKTKRLFSENGLFFFREIVCYLKRCKNCGGSRITVFAESTDGTVYFIERIRSKNVRHFLDSNTVIRVMKNLGQKLSYYKNIPLKYYDKGKMLPCYVNYSSLKIAPYDTDILADLRKKKMSDFN
jgi:hypothetical protein